MSLPLPRPQLVEPIPDDTSPPQQQPEIGIEELFRRHAPAISSLGLSMLQSVEEADDLVQDVFIRAWRAIDRLENREEARPWLMTIAIRLARTRLRRRKLSRLLFRGDISESEQLPAPGALPEHRDLVRKLYAVLDGLPTALHLAWVLRYIHAETVETVAAVCGWSLSTTKRRIQAANERVLSKLNVATKGEVIRS